jgi:hypothetical protein
MSSNDKASDDLCAQLRNLEDSLLDPSVRRDSAQVAALLAEEFEEFGASGRAWTREQILDLLAAERYEPPSVEEFRCHTIADGVVLVTYRAVRTKPHSGERTMDDDLAQFSMDGAIRKVESAVPPGDPGGPGLNGSKGLSGF